MPKLEHKNIVVRDVITKLKTLECQERIISFTKTGLLNIKDAIVEMGGGIYANKYMQEINGVVDFVENTVEGKKYNATILFPTELASLMPTITLLLYAQVVTHELNEIQKDIIKNFFKVIFQEAKRVLKLGGHLLSFSSSRTYHQLASSIEDAGFEIRDQVMWVYATGLPKSLNISKQISKKANAARDLNETTAKIAYNEAIDNAKKYDGWGSSLKPSHESIVMARKPLEKGLTISENVIKHGTGGININACRTPVKDEDIKEYNSNMDCHNRYSKEHGEKLGAFDGGWKVNPDAIVNKGARFPSNFIIDDSEEVEAEFAKYGKKKASKTYDYTGQKEYNVKGFLKKNIPNSPSNRGDGGTASRFFFSAKTSNKDRNEGCEALEPKEWKADGAAIPERANRPFKPSQNNHATVKPTALMEYLIKLITPVGGVVLDPFMGSGSTGKAAMLNGFNFIGIEIDPEFIEIAESRIKWAKEQYESNN